ncbi:MAG: SDR family oxidoreductase [Spirochaetaceae bacterium]|nr:SDR family oxidoreductase [Spirochaetaceae bacterium]
MKYDFSSIKNQNVIITGGSGDIGLAIAKGFLSLKANVFLWGHRPISNTNLFSDYMIVDLLNRNEINRALNSSPQLIHTLVNCAGITIGNHSANYTMEDWDKTLCINLSAPFYLSQQIAKRMTSNKGGSIINITSIGAELGFPGNPAYGASKAGLKNLTKSMACDFSELGIRINNVGPGYTTTKMTAKSWNDSDLRAQRTEHTILKRWATPEDIVGMVLFLASDMSKYITGQDFYIDGGWTAKGL